MNMNSLNLNFHEINTYATRTSADWTIYGLLIAICSLLIAWGLIFYFIRYRKEKRKVLSLKKIIIFSLFFSFFMFQSFLTRLWATSPIIPFSLDNITIIAVGFIFGPIEGLLYGVLADITRVFINGWTPQLLPAFSFALLGLFSGAMGRKYLKIGEGMSDAYSFFSMQIIIIFFAFMTAIAAPVLYRIDPDAYTNESYYAILISAIVALVVMEVLFFYSRKPTHRSYMRLIVYISLINALDRIFFGYLVRSFSQYWYFGYPFVSQLLGRMLTSSYLVPARIITSIALVRASYFAIEQTGGIKNWN